MKNEELKQLFPVSRINKLRSFPQFADVLRDWNQRINLISRQDVDNLWTHHFLPSIIPSTFIDLPAQCWVMDIGSGGGFPAIPLKILYPQWQLLMVESIRKKAHFWKMPSKRCNCRTPPW
ncbi:MAG: RsmG family class I SAM-dependent methyltransferase [Calditrichia bacterium]